jgi:phospholipid/cholesterol/gamma-HCH transport system substrate-binding protein
VLLERGSKLVNRSDDSIHQLRQELLVSAQNLAEATDNLNRFMEILAEQPTQLLLGEPPKPKVEFGEP